MAGFKHDVAGGNGDLVATALQSPNFATGLAGWQVRKDGSAEFNNGTFRGTVTAGTFEGTNYVLTPAGAFWYEGPPAAGNLSASVVPGLVNVTDPHGNTALPGLVSYLNSAGTPFSAAQSFEGGTTFWTWTGTWVVAAVVALAGSVLALSSLAGIELDNDTQSIGVTWNSDWTDITTFVIGFSAGSPSPQYSVEAIGTGTASGPRPHVRLRGEIILTGTTAAGAVMFTLPFGFARTQPFLTPNNLSGYTPPQRVVNVASSGNVQCAAAGSNGNFLVLDGIVAPVS